MELRSQKRTPYCWQAKGAIKIIRERYKGKKSLVTAIGIYNALTEIASNQSHNDHCFAYLSDIGRLVSKSRETVKRYMNEFIKLDLVGREYHQRPSKMYERTKWLLIAVDKKIVTPQHGEQMVPHNTESTPTHNSVLDLEESNKKNLFQKKESSNKKIKEEIMRWMERAERPRYSSPEFAENLLRKNGVEEVQRAIDIHGSQGYGNPIDSFFKHLEGKCECNKKHLAQYNPR